MTSEFCRLTVGVKISDVIVEALSPAGVLMIGGYSREKVVDIGNRGIGGVKISDVIVEALSPAGVLMIGGYSREEVVDIGNRGIGGDEISDVIVGPLSLAGVLMIDGCSREEFVDIGNRVERGGCEFRCLLPPGPEYIQKVKRRNTPRRSRMTSEFCRLTVGVKISDVIVEALSPAGVMMIDGCSREELVDIGNREIRGRCEFRCNFLRYDIFLRFRTKLEGLARLLRKYYFL